MGVGALMKIAVEKGRSVRPGLKVGICGEHGGEPSSVEFCHQIDLNYVSCSPFRVPIARLAAARAALADAGGPGEDRREEAGEESSAGDNRQCCDRCPPDVPRARPSA